MITSKDKNTIESLARKYSVAEVFLFGSAATADEFNDIDIAVKGIDSSLFFKFYGELIFELSKSVDLIDLNMKNPFSELVEREGIKIYG